MSKTTGLRSVNPKDLVNRICGEGAGVKEPLTVVFETFTIML